MVEQLLRSAKVSRRTFYRFFPNLEAVLEGLYDSASRVLVERIEAGLRHGTTEAEKCAGLVDAYLSLNRSEAALMRVLEAEALKADSRLAPRRLALLDSIGEAVMRELRVQRDPLLVHGTLVGLEAVLRRARVDRSLTRGSERRVRAVMLMLMAALRR